MFSQFKWDKAKPTFDAGSSKKSKGSDQKAILCSHDTWTHDVCVLALVNEEIAPNRDRLDQLKCGGLAYFIKKLEEEFPKLRIQMRSSTGESGARPLTPIPLGSQGYCIQELRASLSSATLFVRPLQSDLELDQVVQVTRKTPKVTCIHCGKEVNLSELRVHCQSLECTLARPGTSAQTVDTEGNRDDSSSFKHVYG